MQPVVLTQITDIHLGGDYNGMFPVEENFRKLVDAAKDKSYLVITGDLADKDHEKHYEYIKKIVEEKFGQLYVVLPGNHDNVQVLNEVFKGHTDSVVFHDVPISLVPTVWNKSADKSMGVGVLANYYTPDMMLPNSLVFTHYPVLPTTHRFMGKHALDPESAMKIKSRMLETGSKTIFCGHYHDDCRTRQIDYCEEVDKDSNSKFLYNNNLYQYICPASQCQIDPKSDQFVCTGKSPAGFTIEVWPNQESDCSQYHKIAVSRF